MHSQADPREALKASRTESIMSGCRSHQSRFSLWYNPCWLRRSHLCRGDVNWAWLSLNFLSQTSLHHMVHCKTNISVCCVFMSLSVIYWESVRGSKQALLTWSLDYSVNLSVRAIRTHHIFSVIFSALDKYPLGFETCLVHLWDVWITGNQLIIGLVRK